MYRHRILIVDDDKLLQKPLKQIFSDKYDAVTAGSGEEALAIIKVKAFRSHTAGYSIAGNRWY